MESRATKPSFGVIASRKCPFCGHTEIGYTTPDGSFHPLRPGTLVTLPEPQEPLAPGTPPNSVVEGLFAEDAESEREPRPWVPAVLKGDPKWRVKYGVMVGEAIALKGLSSDTYRSAFLRKIENLLEKEVDTPLPVILDRFFSAPHLASGNPRQISQAMWRELDEIQKPVLDVSEWIEKQDDESLLRMISPVTAAELGTKPVSDQELEAELQSLTLEEFLEML